VQNSCRSDIRVNKEPENLLFARTRFFKDETFIYLNA
jgi:hypothetical protein